MTRHLHSMFLALVAVLWCGATPAQQCLLPQSIGTPVLKPAADPNLSKTDYYAFVLSWSPEHCETRRNDAAHAFQCQLNAKNFDFVVHGLWPQSAIARNSKEHPRNCKAGKSLTPELLKKHLCTVPGVDLMQNEWQAHGTCGWDTPSQYFDTIEKQWSTYKRPRYEDLVKAGRVEKRGLILKVSDIKDAFVAVNDNKLRSDNSAVTVASGNYFREMWICLDLDFQPASCRGQGTKDSQVISVRPIYR
ncbi:ribonuclease T2 family protein [Polaromonas aquatica]|uniref:ribonuclease T2 family protein n=1 Tax=Polaromonas aquatica TaxID=332657 RepID=UPI003D6467F9